MNFHLGTIVVKFPAVLFLNKGHKNLNFLYLVDLNFHLDNLPSV